MRTIAVISFVTLLAGCATSYQPKNFSGGFSETQLDTNVFRVSFHGNGYTRAERVEDLALLRSAELTLKNGFTDFAIIEGRSREQLGSYTTPTQSYTTANTTVYGNTAYGSAHTTSYGGHTFLISKPSTTNTIMCFHGKPDIQAFVYNAQFICDSLGKKYAVVCGASTK
ncbi:MAG: CC0125/CC1285 family lipoprotein [Burkholderiales bacterium]